MNHAEGATIPSYAPTDVWSELEADPTAQLVDVRTRPEWSFVGVPDLTDLGREVILQEWRSFPDMRVSAEFAPRLMQTLSDPAPSRLFFICRSGGRSLEAAGEVARHAAENGIQIECINVAEGFEGDLDPNRHRGAMNGWKARGLAWRQS